MIYISKYLMLFLVFRCISFGMDVIVGWFNLFFFVVEVEILSIEKVVFCKLKCFLFLLLKIEECSYFIRYEIYFFFIKKLLIFFFYVFNK